MKSWAYRGGGAAAQPGPIAAGLAGESWIAAVPLRAPHPATAAAAGAAHKGGGARVSADAAAAPPAAARTHAPARLPRSPPSQRSRAARAARRRPSSTPSPTGSPPRSPPRWRPRHHARLRRLRRPTPRSRAWRPGRRARWARCSRRWPRCCWRAWLACRAQPTARGRTRVRAAARAHTRGRVARPASVGERSSCTLAPPNPPPHLSSPHPQAGARC